MRAFETEILQDDRELAGLVELVKAERCTSMLEIGSKFGGSLWKLARAMPCGSRVVAVDLPNGTRMWRTSQPSLIRCIDELKSQGYDARVIWGDSTSSQIITQVQALAPYDFVFIDANHSMQYVREDWRNYGSLGRMVAFHDIAWKRPPEWVGVRIEVPEFWQHIKQQYQHVEFSLCDKNNGIGVLWRDTVDRDVSMGKQVSAG